MSCNHDTENCVCDILREIARLQVNTPDKCQAGCDKSIVELLNQTPIGRFNTVPFLLICKSTCDYFIGSGIFRNTNTLTFECFESPIFRVSSVDENCCAQIELLQPLNSAGEVPTNDGTLRGICSFFPPGEITQFSRTGICITVDLNCFCGVECLPLVNAQVQPPVPPPPPPVECPCEIHVGTQNTLADVTGTDDGTPFVFEDGRIRVNVLQCLGNCNPNVDNFVVNFRDGGNTFNIRGTRIAFSCTPNNELGVGGSVQFTGIGEVTAGNIFTDPGLFVVTISLTNAGPTGLWTITGDDSQGNSFTTTFTGNVNPNVIESCAE